MLRQNVLKMMFIKKRLLVLIACILLTCPSLSAFSVTRDESALIMWNFLSATMAGLGGYYAYQAATESTSPPPADYVYASHLYNSLIASTVSLGGATVAVLASSLFIKNVDDYAKMAALSLVFSVASIVTNSIAVYIEQHCRSVPVSNDLKISLGFSVGSLISNILGPAVFHRVRMSRIQPALPESALID